MVEQFEQWLKVYGEHLEEPVQNLFVDSLKCFKNEIIRPAYLLAYQGMLMHIKYVIINGTKPDAFNENGGAQSY